MSEDSDFCEVVEHTTYGQLFQKSYGKIDVTWKIANFSNAVISGFLSSPHFAFENATWCLHLYSRRGQAEQGIYEFTIRRLDSSVSEHRVSYRFSMKKCNGEYRSVMGTTLFTQQMLETGGIFHMTQESIWRNKRLTPKNTLTVYLEMQMEDAEIEEPSHSRKISKHATLPEDYHKLWLSKEGSDITIRVKGVEFPAHKNVLRIRSQIFDKKCEREWKRKKVIEVEDCEPAIFRDFLRYLYAGSVERISIENVFGLYSVAWKYGAQELKQDCLEFMKVNVSVDTFTELYVHSLNCPEAELKNMVTNFFKKHYKEILLTAKWHAFFSENPLIAGALYEAVAPTPPEKGDN